MSVRCGWEPVAAVRGAIEDLRRGEFVIVADGREPYGHADLTMAAGLVTPEAINFMATHGGSIIYVCLTEDRCRELGLPPMRRGGDPGRWESAIAVSIEAREGVTTGISAADRARTVRVAADPGKGHEDLVSPGHVFPVCARRGGVLERPGRTEASMDLARLAGLYPAGADCELVTAAGEAARGDNLVRFASEHGIRLITVADVVAFRESEEARGQKPEPHLGELLSGRETSSERRRHTRMSSENPAPDRPRVDVGALRRTLGAFLTGVTVVTTVDEEGSPWGLTANSFTSVSLDPPLVLVCVAEGANSYPAFRDCRSFAVNILAEGQDELSLRFASKQPDKFSGIATDSRSTGAPILADPLAWLDCSVHDKVVAGDHLVLIGRVEAFDGGAGRPLGWYQGNYVTFGLEEEAAVGARAGKRVLVGWIAESEGRLVLARQSDEAGVQRWSIPMSPLGDKQATDDAMQEAAVASLGSNVDVSFLYSVYDTPEENTLRLIYRGRLRQPLPETGAGAAESVRSFGPDEIPWNDIPERDVRNVLERYLHERAADRWGIYTGSVDEGAVTTLGGPQEAWGDYVTRFSGTRPPEDS